MRKHWLGFKIFSTYIYDIQDNIVWRYIQLHKNFLNINVHLLFLESMSNIYKAQFKPSLRSSFVHLQLPQSKIDTRNTKNDDVGKIKRFFACSNFCSQTLTDTNIWCKMKNNKSNKNKKGCHWLKNL